MISFLLLLGSNTLSFVSVCFCLESFFKYICSLEDDCIRQNKKRAGQEEAMVKHQDNKNFHIYFRKDILISNEARYLMVTFEKFEVDEIVSV